MHTINIHGVPMSGSEVGARGASGMKKYTGSPFFPGAYSLEGEAVTIYMLSL